MINKLRYGAAGAAIAAALGLASAAQAADNADAQATAEILSSLTLTVQSGTLLDFGQMVLPNTSGGSVTLAADGTLDCSSVNIVCSGTSSVPTFLISTGTPNKDVTITLPTSTVLANGAGGTTQTEIVLDTFTDSAGGAVTLDGSGAGNFTVGGTIHIDGDETPGVFSGTFNVSVEYA